ncbi:MAG: tetratricopeptide repeat protein [Actinobacteria bacterium]|nr:tetratricopeptide repeat protein [Actinomycetota bacterium]
MTTSTRTDDEISWLADKHFQYFSQLAATAASRYHKPDAAEWLNKLDSAIDDLNAALDRAIADGRPEALTMAIDLSFFWESRWLAEEGAERLAAALDLEGTTQVDRAKGLASLSGLRLSLGEDERAQEAAEEALLLARKSGDRRAEFSALMAVVHCGYVEGNYASALEEVQKALEIARELDDESLIAHSSYFEGLFSLSQGGELGRKRVEEALALARRIGDKPMTSSILAHLALVARGAGQMDLALRYNEEAQQVFDELGSRTAQLWGHMGRAETLLFAAEPREAYRVALEALAFAQQTPSPDLLVSALCYAAWSSAELGQYAEARLHAERAVEIGRRVGSPGSHWAYLNLINVLQAEGQLALAVQASNEAVETLRRIGTPLLIRTLAVQCRTLARAGQFERARVSLEEARELARERDEPWEVTTLTINEARLLEMEGKLDEAEQKYQEIEQITDIYWQLPVFSESLIALSRIKRSRSDPEGAAAVIARGARLMSDAGQRYYAFSALEEGAAVLAALTNRNEAVEILAWADALRAETGVLVPSSEVEALEELRNELEIREGSLPPVATTGVLTADLKEAVETLCRALDVGSEAS